MNQGGRGVLPGGGCCQHGVELNLPENEHQLRVPLCACVPRGGLGGHGVSVAGMTERMLWGSLHPQRLPHPPHHVGLSILLPTFTADYLFFP